MSVPTITIITVITVITVITAGYLLYGKIRRNHHPFNTLL